MRQFNAGDVVVHATYGIGHIVKLEEKRLFGEEARLYYELSTPKSTVWVPVGAGNHSPRLRPVTTKDELVRYRRLLQSRPTVLTKDYRQRNLELAERLKLGSFQALCEVVRDLTAHGWKRPLSDVDTGLLRRVRENLCLEWAAADGVSIAQAVQEIEDLLNQARKKYQ
jgi:RNA polymerase-interacting CarD/CdnL/TRCF family regulator